MYDEDTETIIVFPAIGSYHCGILGINEGTYSLKIGSVENGNTTTFNATNIPTTVNAVHNYTVNWEVLSLGLKGVTVQVDSEGDGAPEHIFTSDRELTRSEYLMAVGMAGDLNTDGKVDMRDIGLVAVAFGSYPGHPRWDPETDIWEDKTINLKDIGLVAKHFGDHSPCRFPSPLARRATRKLSRT